MKVKELIEALQKIDPEDEIKLHDWDYLGTQEIGPINRPSVKDNFWVIYQD